MSDFRKLAIAFGVLTEAKINRTDRVALLAYLAAKKNGVDTFELADTFGRTRSAIYGALIALEKARLTRQELRDEVTNGPVKNKVGYWYATPFGKDLLSKFEHAIK